MIIKKIFFILFLIILFIACPNSQSKARDFSPISKTSVKSWGIGVYYAPKDFYIYKNPDDNSTIIEHVIWNELGTEALNPNLSAKNLFIAFHPKKNIALMNVTDEIDGWCQVVYNEDDGTTGWVKEFNPSQFNTWQDLMNNYGKTNGLSIFNDSPKMYQKLRTNPQDDAQIQQDYEYLPDNIRLSMIKGNWMLVRFMNFDSTIVIGWTKWRNDDGELFAFPKFDDN